MSGLQIAARAIIRLCAAKEAQVLDTRSPAEPPQAKAAIPPPVERFQLPHVIFGKKCLMDLDPDAKHKPWEVTRFKAAKTYSFAHYSDAMEYMRRIDSGEIEE